VCAVHRVCVGSVCVVCEVCLMCSIVCVCAVCVEFFLHTTFIYSLFYLQLTLCYYHVSNYFVLLFFSIYTY
jgi:hypothetical protein